MLETRFTDELQKTCDISTPFAHQNYIVFPKKPKKNPSFPLMLGPTAPGL